MRVSPLLPGAETRARLREAISCRLRTPSPLWLAFGAAFAVAAPSMASTRDGGALGLAVGVVRAGVLSSLVAAPVALAIGMLDSYAENLAARQAQPRPRWEYLVFMLCYIAVALAGMVIARRYEATCLADLGGALATWSLIASAAMAGRAVCWGEVRPMFWLHRPLWLTQTPGEPCFGQK